eukprot:CAMPEP_0198365194 /NCGR_PEP_ID=MMETSP1450-20131203/154047_1 /TAXON_ID=753684 ORGANISM="Madagascaria erythrocladiodes, Strain CCMP3234" /NCGR_SAMPLE_ID=MMETSP1450 /ASSEMBLY_ACC=CAM_ASM_001115 /LENGTH=304 /DNA_ID=CAMNT_0044072639 /DNA_START=911 /DNA_END=1825 /DNA_ORIENTATION=-
MGIAKQALVFSVCLAAVVVASAASCRCRQHDLDDMCTVAQATDMEGVCLFKRQSCTGCVCDEEGDMECDLVESPGYISTGPMGERGECIQDDIVKTVCPHDKKVMPKRILRDFCDYNALLDVEDQPCMVTCFPPEYGKLDHITVRFASNYSGNLFLENTQSSPLLGLIRVEQIIATEITMNGAAVWPTDPSASIASGVEYDVGPTMNAFFFPPNHSETRQVSGYGTGAVTDPLNGNGPYMCSPANGPYDIAFSISAKMRRLIFTSMNVQTSGHYHADIEIEYVFDPAPGTGATVGEVYTPPVEM